MNIELNLWFSARSGKLFGNLNINQKEVVENIDKLLSIQEFTLFTYKKKLMTEAELSAFINDPDRDEDALYAWTKGNSIVSWNTEKDTAFVIYNNQQYKLALGKEKRNYRGMPDMYFRG